MYSKQGELRDVRFARIDMSHSFICKDDQLGRLGCVTGLNYYLVFSILVLEDPINYRNSERRDFRTTIRPHAFLLCALPSMLVLFFHLNLIMKIFKISVKS